MRKKRRSRYKHIPSRVISKLLKLSKQYKPIEPESEPIKLFPKEIYLSSLDRITRISSIDKNKSVVDIINVSYEIKYDEKWITIVRYDSAHGYLHRHKRISINDTGETVDREGVKTKGNPHVWYTWAIKDIQKRFLEYRREFAKRSNIVNFGY